MAKPRPRARDPLKEALEQQAATADILKAISRSPADTQPVFDAIVRHATRLCESAYSNVFRYDGEQLHLAASTGASAKVISALRRSYPAAPNRSRVVGRVIRTRRVVHVVDTLADREYDKAFAGAFRNRRILGVPLLRGKEPVGAITVAWPEPGPILRRHENLLKTFADHAVIAIENVRLFNETREALERQTATSQVLGVISRSPTDLKPVFDAILKSAMELCEAHLGVLNLYDGERLRTVAQRGGNAELAAWVVERGAFKPDGAAADAIEQRRAVHIADAKELPAYREGRPNFTRFVDLAHARTFLAVPLLKDNKVVGNIGIYRAQVRPFTEQQLGLVDTFAAQAVIAIENVRLFNETKEALERQTATSEVLKTISRSTFDLNAVLEVLIENATRLAGAQQGFIFRFDGEVARLAYSYNAAPAYRALMEATPLAPGRGSLVGRTLLERRPVHIPDALADPEFTLHEAQRAGGFRSMLGVPMMREGKLIGVIAVWATEVKPFTEKQIELVSTFADQAVIAIENVRLFNETREALERQKASAEVLRVISGSLEDTRPVFEAIVASGARLYEAHQVGINVLDPDGRVALRAYHGPNRKEFEAYMNGESRQAGGGGLRLKRRLAHFPDVEAGTEVPDQIRGGCRITGTKAIIYAPMISGGKGIGAIWVGRDRVGPFSDKEIALLQTFADQAVIAIQNARLFGDTKEALERQTATAEILRVISSTPTDTQPVFDAIVSSTQRLIAGKSAVLLLRRDPNFVVAAYAGPEVTHLPEEVRVAPLDRDKNFPSRAILDGEIVHVPDWQGDDVIEHERNVGKAFGIKSGLMVPLLREGKGIGAIAVTRGTPGPYHEKEVALLRSFADQAVIAIENVRLFEELQERTEALTKSVGQLTALGEVGQAISSTLDLETVLKTIVSRAVQLTGLNGGSIYEFDELKREFHLRAAENMPDELAEVYRRMPIRLGEGIVGGAAAKREPVQVPDIQDPSYQTRYRELLLRQGYRAILAVPLLREEQIIGALTVSRNEPGAFAPQVVELLKTFATQSAVAIQNARLFREIAQKSRELEVASRHKSQFLASMSHELRTPLNAILGFNEMILGQVYGEVPQDMKEPLEDIQKSGKHLLRLINNVLDLAKIEAGKMELALADYSVQDTVESVRSTLRPLAEAKGLELLASVPQDIPLAYGDGGRLAQCLMNLAGNSLKFTRQGRVEIVVEAKDGRLTWRVSDTGIGIPPDKIETLFSEFRQTDATIASEYGGTGLGLSITKKFVEMHGGRIWVESEWGAGSAFMFEVPLRVATA